MIANRFDFKNKCMVVETEEFLDDKRVLLDNVHFKNNVLLIGDSLNDRYMC